MPAKRGRDFEAPDLERGISNAWNLQFCKQPFEIIQGQIAFKNTVQCVNKETVAVLLHPVFSVQAWRILARAASADSAILDK